MRCIPNEHLKRQQREMRVDKIQRLAMWVFITVVVIVAISELF